MSADLFDQFARFTDRILLGIENQERPAQKYKTTLGLINQIFVTTHEMVAELVEHLERAATVEEAQAILEELNYEPLTESFRAEGLCDTFEGLGIALRNINDRYGPPNIDSSDTLGAYWMADALVNREREVADIYIGQIQEMADLVGGSRTDLDEIRAHAHAARTVLTNQISDFASKSQRFLGSPR